ncbi:acyl-CoA dehydrogenase family protein [Corallococcus sicarius]|uniref:acyl-CoA dehydrogenase family protein n=1 Tax=Corallococcus sicarius TaxID=2316726 RepID=UPI001FC9464E|nr:acyl-CoA dehydrogenase family protein [Corallococcus sicarius]
MSGATLGMRATRCQLLHFQDTLLPESRRLPLDPSQPNLIALSLPWISIGIPEAALAFAIPYAREHKLPPENRATAEMQWVQFSVAELGLRLEAARALAMRARSSPPRPWSSLEDRATCAAIPLNATCAMP